MSILITGGTGSFGQAFVKHCLDMELSRICIYSRDEAKQAEMRQKFNNDIRLRFFIGDVRDKGRLEEAMHGIDIVVHAAALKRIETCHYNPTEMVKTNINGTVNVIEAAVQAGVGKVVGLSTDKAWQPISAYGQSKALAESLFLAANEMHKGRVKFAVTRYGNVAGSKGSVIPLWKALIQNQLNPDGPITSDPLTVPVTDPDCTRFYMTMEEAVQLVDNTILTMEGGELVIPETLPAYRLGDLAEAMDAEMDIKGLPEWEKKHEGMRDGLTSDIARRMSVEELKQCTTHIK